MHQKDDDLDGENIYAGWGHDLPLLEATDAEGSCSGIHGRDAEVGSGRKVRDNPALDLRSGIRG